MTAAAPMPRREAAELLGVAEDAAAQEVQRAYLRAARRTHPDTVPEADEAAKRAAGAAFDRLTRARDVLLASLPVDPLQRAAYSVRPEGPGGPHYRRAPGRDLGGSLIVLALLGFLLIGLVSLEQGLQGPWFDQPAATTAP